MKAQQIRGDYLLFFDRRAKRFNRLSKVGVNGELAKAPERPLRLEALVEDSNGEPTGERVLLINKENSTELGVKISFQDGELMEIMFAEKAYSYLEIYSRLDVSLPRRTGKLRIFYDIAYP